MRNIWKRTAAALLAVALCFSFAGCYDENKSWAARRGDDELPIGAYIYYLYSAYSEATSMVDENTVVLDATIEDTDASEWIQNRAMEYLNSYYYINQKFEDYGLEVTEEDMTSMENSTASIWSYYQSTFEDLGISRESFDQAFTQYNAKYVEVMKATYGEGGDLALADGEMEQYFTDNYYYYEYFYASLSKTDEDGNSVDLSESEQEDMVAELENYVDQINGNQMTVSAAADAYASNWDRESTYQSPSPTTSDGIIDTLLTAIESLDENEAGLAETSTGYYVVRRLPIAEAYASYDQETLLSNMKGTEFSDYVMEQAASLEDIELNQSAIDSVRLSSLVNDSNRYGTIIASDGDSSSETSSDTSSSEEQQDSSTAEESSAAEDSSADESASSVAE